MTSVKDVKTLTTANKQNNTSVTKLVFIFSMIYIHNEKLKPGSLYTKEGDTSS